MKPLTVGLLVAAAAAGVYVLSTGDVNDKRASYDVVPEPGGTFGIRVHWADGSIAYQGGYPSQAAAVAAARAAIGIA